VKTWEHIPHLARYFAEETLVMYAGQTVEGGPSEEVIQRPRHPYTQLLISAAPDPDRLGPDGKSTVTLPARGEIPSLIHPPSGCRFHPRCPYAMPVCSERFPQRTDLGGGHWTHCFLFGDGEAEVDHTSSSLVDGVHSASGEVERGHDEPSTHDSQELKVNGDTVLSSNMAGKEEEQEQGYGAGEQLSNDVSTKQSL